MADGMTIGEFSRAAGLTAKALRLYDRLGLLPPARVDPDSGYRYYESAQLERARTVAWLRRLGMPLEDIRRVCALDGPGAARAVEAYWTREESDHAARRGTAALLTDHLAGPDRPAAPPLVRHAAALTSQGPVRAQQQDAALANGSTMVVADGHGPRGAEAANAAAGVLARLDLTTVASRELPEILRKAYGQAQAAVRAALAGDGGDADAPSDTTLTALCWTGARLALLHVGDGRAYLLRDGRLSQLTVDHTLVHRMVEDGRLTPEEAAAHPQRALLVRSVGHGPGRAGLPADTLLWHVRPGDRYLVCTDGLSAVVPEHRLHTTLTEASGPEDAVRDLVDLTHAFGAPDNVGCAVADFGSAA